MVDFRGRERSSNIEDRRNPADRAAALAAEMARNGSLGILPAAASLTALGVGGFPFLARALSFSPPQKLEGTVGAPIHFPHELEPFYPRGELVGTKRYRDIMREFEGRRKLGKPNEEMRAGDTDWTSDRLRDKGAVGFVGGMEAGGTSKGGDAVDKRVIDTIIAEALGEGDAGMTAVAYTIINRSNKRGLTPLEVVKQKSQYTGYSNPGSSVKRAMSDPNVRARVEAIWNNVTTGAVPDPTNGGEYFHTTSISPGWSKGVNKNGTTTIGNHVFYKGRAPTVTALASPEVPPRRPDSGASAVAAIDSAFAPSIPSASASAYAQPPGRVSGLSAGAPLPPAPRTNAIPVPPRNALPGPPAASGVPIPPRSAVSLPSGSAAPLRPSLPAVSPLIPTMRARDITGPEEAEAIASFNASQPKPRTPPSSTFDLAMMLPGYAENYVPTAERVKPPGLTTRKVNTVPIDPMTGGIAGAPSSTDLATALEAYAETRRPKEPATMTVRSVNKGIPASDYGEAIAHSASSYPTIQPSPTLGVTLAADLNPDLDTRPRGPVNRGGRTKGYVPPPGIGINAGGVPFDLASVERTKNSTPGVMPPTATATLPPKPVRTSLNAFDYTAPPVPDRLTPNLPFDTRGVGGKLSVADTYRPAPPLPKRRPDPNMPYGQPGYGPVNPTAYDFPADPVTKMALEVGNGPGARFASEMSLGEHPIAAWLVKMFGPKEGRVSTARSIAPPRYGLTGGLSTPPSGNTYALRAREPLLPNSTLYRRLSEPTTKLVGSGGNNAWRWIMGDSTDASDQPPRERRYLSR